MYNKRCESVRIIIAHSYVEQLPPFRISMLRDNLKASNYMKMLWSSPTPTHMPTSSIMLVTKDVYSNEHIWLQCYEFRNTQSPSMY